MNFRKNLLIQLIVLAGFILRMLAIVADPFLHPWDERFHALVARNMMDHPWTPMLRARPVTEHYDRIAWCCNHIWVHKQPLFMWQMAISMKLFGVSEWSMRLPSAIMGTLLIVAIYRISVLLTSSKKVGLLAALMLAFSNFHLQLVSGVMGMDHNDVAHGFYVVLSIWAICEYYYKPKWYWALLAGVFSGAAILNKWLTGLLVYLVWAVVIIKAMADRQPWKRPVVHLLGSLVVCCIVFVPWQLHIMKAFPDLASYEYAFNRRHITEALEGHNGTIFFYGKYRSELFGSLMYLFAPVGMWLSLRDKTLPRGLNLGVITGILFVFLFFSLIVKTKVVNLVFFVVPLALIYSAVFLSFLFSKVITHKALRGVAVAVIIYLCINPSMIFAYYSSNNKERNTRIYNARIYRNLHNLLPRDVKVVMNMNSFEDVDVMFYNKDLTAHHWTLSESDFKELAQKKIPVAVFEQHGGYTMADYVYKYPYLYIIRQQLREP